MFINVPVNRLFIWHYLAYQIDKRLFQYSINPFYQVDLNDLSKVGAKQILDLNEENRFDYIITTLNHSHIDLNWYNNTNNPIIQWVIPTNEIQNSILSKKVKMPIIFKYFYAFDQGVEFKFCKISNEFGVVNAYEKYAWYSALELNKILINNLKPTKKYSSVSKVRFKYFKFFKFYLGNVIFLFNRKFNPIVKKWKLAYSINGQINFLKLQPKGSFWADPFPIQHNNRSFVFFEEMNYEVNRGEIACVEIDSENNILQKNVVLKDQTHFSFPNVFEQNGEMYMLPENSQSNQLMLYKAIEFPVRWEPFFVLMPNVKLLDPIWFFHDSLYWIMGNKIHEFEYENNNSLYLYYSSELFSQNWTPHPMNPVVTDAQFARNAGRIIKQGDELIRVSQNCALNYGTNVNFMKIDVLNTQYYKEIIIAQQNSLLGADGLHTFNISDNIIWLDYLFN